MPEPYDLLILGSGSTAFAAAIRATELGARVVMTERRTLGGTCANRGCLRSKNLIEAARIVWQAAHPRYEGLAPARVEVDFPTLVRQKDAVVRDYRAKKYAAVAETIGVEVLVGGRPVHRPPQRRARRAIEADRFLIATGSRPTIPAIPGLETVPYLTSDLLDADEAGRLDELPESLVILGGGVVAVELGQLFARLGSRVTIIAPSALLRGFEPILGETLGEVFRAEGIEVLTDARVERVSGDGRAVAVAVETPFVWANRPGRAAPRRVRADPEHRRPRPRLGRRGGRRERLRRRGGRSPDDPAPHLGGRRRHRAAARLPDGDAGGRPSAAPRRRERLRQRPPPLRRLGRPPAVFVDPPIATVGLTETEVKARRLPAVVATTPLAYVPRAGAIHRTEGVVKMVASTLDERILGVHVIGEGAPEIIHEAAMALRFRATIGDFVELIHVYPTMAEALKIGAQAFSRDVSKLSCCAK